MSEQADHSGIRIAEIFYSIQGEGLYVGTPSIFVRMFGCNFTCSGFSMPRGTLSDERFGVDPDKYQKYEDLPLVHTGCDSYASWDHRFKHLSPWMTFEQIVDRIVELLPGGRFGSYIHLILTGGEPLLWQAKIPGLINEIWRRNLGLTHLTFETNGTQKLDRSLAYQLLNKQINTTFSISSKLPSSGHPLNKAILPDVVNTYYVHPSPNRYFKFVVSSPEDLDDIKKAINIYRLGDAYFPVYLMPAGGTTEHYEANKKWVAQICLENGWAYSPRLQIDLFGNQWGT